MAVCNGNGASSGSKLHLETMQTVMPMNPTDPKLSLPVSAYENLGSGIYKRCFNIVLCYKKASDEDSASIVTAWIKESLGRALSEQPLLAGRLRRKDGVEGELEIVSNDSGVRLIEATFAMTLQDFLDLEKKKEAESQLVFWEDIDYEQNPQFSPLFYIQVSNFKCGGYAIGISCSLLLIDPFSMISFLKKWTGIHLEITSKGDAILPIFLRPKLAKNNRSSLGLPISSSTKAGAAQSVIFEIASKILILDKDIHKNIAALCIDEAEQKLQLKTAPNVSMVVKESTEGVIKVQNLAREELIQKPFITVNGITCSSNWDHLETDQICFRKGNKAAHVSCWINSVLDEDFVMIFPSHENDSEGLKIIVTLLN